MTIFVAVYCNGVSVPAQEAVLAVPVTRTTASCTEQNERTPVLFEVTGFAYAKYVPAGVELAPVATNLYPLLVPPASVESIKHADVEVGTVVPVQVPPKVERLLAKPTVG